MPAFIFELCCTYFVFVIFVGYHLPVAPRRLVSGLALVGVLSTALAVDCISAALVAFPWLAREFNIQMLKVLFESSLCVCACLSVCLAGSAVLIALLL